jgi:putative transposase
MGTRKNWSEEQIIGILKQVEAGRTVAEVCRENGVGESTYYKWKSKYGGLEVNEARRLKSLETENARLKRLLADAMLDNAALKDALSKNW